MEKLQVAVENKKDPKKREGALAAYEVSSDNTGTKSGVTRGKADPLGTLIIRHSPG